MAKGMKARGLKGGNSNGAPSVDWKAIHDQVDEGTQGARISVMVDLGMHTEGMFLSAKGQTGFTSEEDAEQWIKEMKTKYGVKHDVFKGGVPEVEDADDVEIGKYTKTVELSEDGEWLVTKDDPEYIVSANEFGGEREYQELAIFADLTECPVDYGPETGEKPFRVLLNGHFNKKVKGFVLKKSAPNDKDGVWTVKSNTKLNELATATGNKGLIEVDLEEADWSEMLGCGFNVTIEKAGDEGQYLNVGKCVALKRKKNKATGEFEVEELEDLEGEPILLTFDGVTVEDLEAAHLRIDVINKIKEANDYKGSDMQTAIEEFEKRKKAAFKAKSTKSDDSDDGEGDDEGEAKKTTSKVTKVVKEKVKPKDKVEKNSDPEEDTSETDEDDWEA